MGELQTEKESSRNPGVYFQRQRRGVESPLAVSSIMFRLRLATMLVASCARELSMSDLLKRRVLRGGWRLRARHREGSW